MFLDIFGSEKSDHEDIIETSDKEPDVKVETKPLQSKSRRRKAVKKTFEDDEGFLGKIQNVCNIICGKVYNVCLSI